MPLAQPARVKFPLLDPQVWRRALSSQPMAVIGGILGALIGFAVGILFTEVIFANNQSWPDVVPFALAIAGIFVGSTLGRRVRQLARSGLCPCAASVC